MSSKRITLDICRNGLARFDSFGGVFRNLSDI